MFFYHSKTNNTKMNNKHKFQLCYVGLEVENLCHQVTSNLTYNIVISYLFVIYLTNRFKQNKNTSKNKYDKTKAQGRNYLFHRMTGSFETITRLPIKEREALGLSFVHVDL